VKTYIAKKEVLDAYNSKYMRAGVLNSQEIYFEAYNISFFGRLKLLFSFFKKQGLSPASKNFLDKSLGVKENSATIKNNGGLNTAVVGDKDQLSLPF
jgi:hypothetical protein